MVSSRDEPFGCRETVSNPATGDEHLPRNVPPFLSTVCRAGNGGTGRIISDPYRRISTEATGHRLISKKYDRFRCISVCILPYLDYSLRHRRWVFLNNIGSVGPDEQWFRIPLVPSRRFLFSLFSKSCPYNQQVFFEGLCRWNIVDWDDEHTHILLRR